ncbi:hypothetical protein [Streptomyces sp. NBC_01233]|uniref:hypothetical protein n=1 Tax=Streptomyces sp. NBC_01233 TaxID=2903787 RepID=UPI002E0EA280|nr:hypothetical protein OG332_37185 [Streptomyces sp. NBC_01233]
MDRPPELSDADWADYQAAARDDASIQSELADREAQIESGLISSYEEYDFTWEPADDRTWPGGLDDLAATFEQAMQSIVLLDTSGNVPKTPLQPLLYQQMRQAQELAHAANRVLDEAARPDQIPTLQGIAALAHLASAAALSAAAVGSLAEALKTEAEPSRSPRRTVEWRLVIAHADARRDLRRAGEAIRSAKAQIAPPPLVLSVVRTTGVAQLPMPGPPPRIRR